VSSLWPIAEPAQADYERLREIVLTDGELGELLAARRFERRGLAGLISWPAAEPPSWAPRAGLEVIDEFLDHLVPVRVSRRPERVKLRADRRALAGARSTRAR
jgi:hypothetical protein